MTRRTSNKKHPVQIPNEGVGYKRPPRHGQFKPGQSGNPAGRPKKPKKSDAELLESAFNRTVMVKKGGEEVRMTANEALFEKLFSMALAGDLRAARLLISLREKAGLSTATEAPVQLANLPPRAKTFDEWLINTGRKRADGSDPSEDDGSS